MTDMSEIVLFFKGQPNRSGLNLHDIHSFTRTQLEERHDFIQWLFPTKQPSAFNPDVPSLTQSDINCFSRYRPCRKRLIANLELMLQFYGFRFNADAEIEKATSFRYATSQWVTPHNHNFLRISRMLDSLMTLGCQQYAIHFYNALVEHLGDEVVLGTALVHWQNKIKRKGKAAGSHGLPA